MYVLVNPTTGKRVYRYDDGFCFGTYVIEFSDEHTLGKKLLKRKPFFVATLTVNFEIRHNEIAETRLKAIAKINRHCVDAGLALSNRDARKFFNVVTTI